jgi:hypothetical protein
VKGMKEVKNQNDFEEFNDELMEKARFLIC